MTFSYDVCVVGGCGHVGLPLAITFAAKNLRVCIHDINEAAVASVGRGTMCHLQRKPGTRVSAACTT